ncbi:MAG: hypothetical protein PHS07_04000 [Patescibacteria group bacterium]|nr:hypothetical protein [Patescibacteria group bacterium]
MNKNIFYKKIQWYKKEAILIVLAVLILSLILTFIQPFEYRASAQILVIRKQTAGMDAYTAVKSSEKIASGLTTIVYSSSFMGRVLSSGYEIDPQQFSEHEDKRRKEWKESIDAYVVPDTGLIKLNIYNQDKIQASQIAQAIIYVLTTSSDQYHGAGENVEIKVIDTPILSKYPVRPNIFINFILSLILGFLLATVYIYLKPIDNVLTQDLKRFKMTETIGQVNFKQDYTANRQPILKNQESELIQTNIEEPYETDHFNFED